MSAVKKKKKKIIIAAIAVVVVAVILVLVFRPKGPSHPLVETYALERGSLMNTVGVTGNVVSVESEKVYTTLNYPVKTLHVEAGDQVQAGDILCELDTEALEASIAQKTASYNQAYTTNQLSLQSAQQDLEAYKRGLKNNADSTLMSAQSTLESAQLALENAELDLRVAQRNVRDAQNDYNGTYNENDMENIQQQSDRNSLNTLRDTVEQKELALKNAKEALKRAEKALAEAKTGSSDSLTAYENKVKSAQNNANMTADGLALQDLKNDLEKCMVTAPVSGTVTAVFASEGASPSGILFVIEDIDRLKVKTRIKEYDVGLVETGNRVEIKSDATGEDVYEGELSKVAPASVKNAQGEVDTSADIEFEAEVSVKSDNKLRVGMKTRMDIVVEEKNDIFSVPYEAVTMNENGEQIVYVARTDGAGITTAQPVVVTTGMENDFNIEIDGEGLADGDQIILNPMEIAPGMQVTLMPAGGVMGPDGPITMA